VKQITTFTTTLFVLIVACLVAWAAPALAFRPQLSEAFLKVSHCKHCAPSPEGDVPPPEGQLEDPCGLAIAPSGAIYVADYYHRAVDVFSGGGEYSSQIALPGGPFSGLGRNELDSVCGLAINSSGDLWANEWHQGVVRLEPSEFRLDSGESTGVAVDAAGDVFVDDRTYVAEYTAPVHAGEESTTLIGQGSLGDGYGVAVSSSGGRVYVADAASGTVKVFEPAGDPETAVASLAPPGGFTSLVDSALAIDATVEPGLPEHLLVLDNLEPGYEHPEAAVEEFEAPGSDHPASYAYVGRLTGPAAAPIVDGEPSGLAVDSAGDVLVTDGNGELGNAFEFGPDPPGFPEEPSSAVGPPSSVVIESAPASTEPSAAATSVASAEAPPRVTSRRRHRHHRRHRRGASRRVGGRPGSRSAKARRIR
jgi:DNA-binding beta-propeller fold protein YncE